MKMDTGRCYGSTYIIAIGCCSAHVRSSSICNMDLCGWDGRDLPLGWHLVDISITEMCPRVLLHSSVVVGCTL